MKKISIMLTLFLFSCEELEEQTAPLPGGYYVFEGWNAFMAQDYDRAKELFSATLLADQGSETNYYDYAYAGLGWTAIYKANINPGIQNKLLRENLRDSAIVHFESAINIITDILITDLDTTINLNIDSSQDSLMYANVMAGRIFNTSYLALDRAMEYYSDGSYDSVWVDALIYSQRVISYSDSLFSTFPDYNFEYDENINVEDIRLLRAQSYIRLGDLENAAIEIESITNLDCDLSQISVIECLHSTGLNP
jgi:tetratricopeptide (TPR) repeat protein